jgi:hypothetical protein
MREWLTASGRHAYLAPREVLDIGGREVSDFTGARHRGDLVVLCLGAVSGGSTSPAFRRGGAAGGPMAETEPLGAHHLGRGRELASLRPGKFQSCSRLVRAEGRGALALWHSSPLPAVPRRVPDPRRLPVAKTGLRRQRLGAVPLSCDGSNGRLARPNRRAPSLPPPCRSPFGPRT